MAHKGHLSITIRRATHDKNFFSLVNSTAQDSTLSYAALGLLVSLLSRPTNWQVFVSALSRDKSQRDTVYGLIKELTAAGYITPRAKTRDERGRWVWTPCTVHETPQPRPVTELPDTVSPDTVKAEIKTKDRLTNNRQTKDAVVVVSAAATESRNIPLTAELPQPKPADSLREGKDDEQTLIEAGLKNNSNDTLNHPVPQHPLSPSAEVLVTSLGKAEASRTLAVELMDTYGEARVSAVWQYVQANTDTLRTPVAFLRSELANPRYVPLHAAVPAVLDGAPVMPAPDSDEAEIETQADAAPVVDASVQTLVDGKDTALTKWSLVANQLALKGSRAIKDAQLVAYDASTQTYTVLVASLEAHKQLSGRNARVVASTLTGLHAGSRVTFIVREPIQQGT